MVLSIAMYKPKYWSNIYTVLRLVEGRELKELILIDPVRAPKKWVRSMLMGRAPWDKITIYSSWAEFRQKYPFWNRMVGLEIHPKAQDIHQFKWPPSPILISGNENIGLPPEIIESLEPNLVYIPIEGVVKCYNVATAIAMAITVYSFNIW